MDTVPFLLIGCSVVLFMARRELRQPMSYAGLVMLPLTFLSLFLRQGAFNALALQTAEAVAIGALAVGVYQHIGHRHLTPERHPARPRLIWLGWGPLLAVLLLVYARIPLVVAVLIAGATMLLALLILCRSLVWDGCTSAIGLALMYATAYLIIKPTIVGEVENLWWSHTVSGITLYSLPVEELIAVGLFGALWGPLYLALKDHLRLPSKNFKPASLRPKMFLVMILTLMLCGVSTVAGQLLWTAPRVAAASPATGQVETSWRPDIAIRFTVPVDRKALVARISPDVEGDWLYGESLSQTHLFKALSFKPHDYLAPSTTYTVSLAHIQSYGGHGDSSYSFSFTTRGLPTIASVSVQEKQVDVPMCDPLRVQLDARNEKRAEFIFSLKPELPVVTTLESDDKTMVVTPAGCLSQGTTYTLRADRVSTVYDTHHADTVRRGVSETVLTRVFSTKKAPGISDYAPKGTAVLTDLSRLSLTLDQGLASGQVLGDFITISPALPGVWTVENGTTAVFTPSQKLAFATGYTVTAKMGLKDAKGGFLPANQSLSFTTIGHATVSRINPVTRSGGVTVSTPVQVIFDQEVDHSSAERAFSITPKVSGTFSWVGRVLTFAHTGLSKDEHYTVALAAGITSVHGLATNRTYTSSFYSEESVTLLNIPVYYQRKSLSCEAASTAMALAYKGAAVGEESIIADVGFDTTTRTGTIWGDPDQAFVGAIDGKQNTTGYGVHAGPIARAAGKYRSVKAVYGGSLGTITGALGEGNPVVFWGIYPGGTRDTWQTVTGKTINTWKGEHVRTVVGFKGRASNPRQIIINDPIAGRLYWDTATFLANWSTLGNMAVIIY